MLEPFNHLRKTHSATNRRKRKFIEKTSYYIMTTVAHNTSTAGGPAKPTETSHFKLNPDENFHFEILRVLNCAPSNGADIAEVLARCPKIKPGDFESWAAAWTELAERVEKQAGESDPSTSSGRTSARNAYLRAASYYRNADFFLHGNPQDPRIMSLWDKHLKMFEAGISLMPYETQRMNIETSHGFHIPATLYKASDANKGLRPTLIIGNGFDGSQEEMLHIIGWQALERGFNVMSYEGPGQPTVRRYQGLGFIPKWEKVVTPVVDYLEAHQKDLNVDFNKLGLWGQSMGGMLGLRAVAFEHRFKAYIACDGVWNVDSIIPKALLEDFNEEYAQKLLETIKTSNAETGLRWLMTHGSWAMFDEKKFPKDLERPADIKALVDQFRKFNLDGVVDQVECKVFVGDADDDIFFKGQPKKLADALGDKATYHLFSSADDSDAHCQVGAVAVLAQKTLDWFEKVVN
ncbi:2,6-dihydropseudooxynicotine hydrolase [Pestalotiopsis sp. NC0098]|nr:2,6-dihydropseudooxynicotine hydrolase [Pestalotiopsis sp. NC0098]